MIARSHPRRGAALIIALLIATLLTIIVVEFVYSTAIDLRQAKRFKDDAQDQLAVETGLLYAEILLRDDKTHGEDREIDTLDDVWAAAEIPSSIGNASIRVTITDEASKLNLNNLVFPNDEWKERWFNAFIRLCEVVRQNSGQENYEEIAREIIDYMEDEKQFDLENEEDRFEGAALLSVDDLLEVEGVTKEFLYGNPSEEDPSLAALEGMWNYLTLYSHGRINLNTAENQVIQCLSEGIDENLASDIVSHRSEEDTESERKNYFRSKSELLDVEGMNERLAAREEESVGQTIFQSIEDMVTCKTQFFLVEIQVDRGDDVSRTFRAYYKRYFPGNGPVELFRLLLEEVSPERSPLPPEGVDSDLLGLPF